MGETRNVLFLEGDMGVYGIAVLSNNFYFNAGYCGII